MKTIKTIPVRDEAMTDQNEEENPFYLDTDGYLLRFNEIMIQNSVDHPGDLEACFKWHGKVTAILIRENVQITTKDSISIMGIRGSQRVDIIGSEEEQPMTPWTPPSMGR